MASKIKVAITGATGRTSCSLVRKILTAKDCFDVPKCLLRSIAKAKEKYEDVWGELEGNCHEVDITADNSTDLMTELLKDCNALVILTSVVVGFKDGRVFFLPDDGTNKGSPELVDWIGQQRQVDAAKRAGVAHIVMVGSMGTTKAAPDKFMGCFKYKRQSEDYLIESGLTYTIVNPCMLVDGEEGTRELVFSKSDKLHFSGSSKEYQVARKTVAEVVFQTLLVPEAKNKAFDLLGRVEIPPTKPVDYVAVFKEMTPGL